MVLLALLAAAQVARGGDTLAPITVSVTRLDTDLFRSPVAIYSLDGTEVRRGRQTLGLDEALATVPGVHAANRYNFSVDQRLSIRGFGARSAFSVRGVKVLLDGIPQTLPDGQSQLTNLDLGQVARIDVLRGTASALYGNAAGGVVSIITEPVGATDWSVFTEAGTFDDALERTWNKWQADGGLRVAGGGARVSVSRLWWSGARQHSIAESWRASARVWQPITSGVSASAQLSAGHDPRADNPGGLTAAELVANRDSASAANLAARAGKEVLQAQAGATLRAAFGGGGHADLALFAVTRDLENPLPQAYITFDRLDYGARASATRPLSVGGRPLSLTAGLDAQWQRDDRLNYLNAGGEPNRDSVRLDQLERVSEIGPFAAGVLDLAARLSISAGARYDRVRFRIRDRLVSNGDDSGERTMAALSGSAGLSFAAAPAVMLYGNVATAFETPTTTELVNRPDGSGGLNPDLEPQRAVSAELGARGSWWTFALFQADVRDELVSFEDTLVPGRRFFRNAGRARHRGLEVGASAHLAYGLELVAAYTFADYRYLDYKFDGDTLDGRALPGIPRHLLHLSLRAEPAWLGGAWAALDGSYSSGYFVDDTLTLKNAPWSVVNLRLGWDGAVGSMQVAPFLGVNNLLSREYVGSVAVNAARGRYFEPAPKRNIYVGLRIGGRDYLYR